jgi:hypothetical protein
MSYDGYINSVGFECLLCVHVLALLDVVELIQGHPCCFARHARERLFTLTTRWAADEPLQYSIAWHFNGAAEMSRVEKPVPSSWINVAQKQRLLLTRDSFVI